MEVRGWGARDLWAFEHSFSAQHPARVPWAAVVGPDWNLHLARSQTQQGPSGDTGPARPPGPPRATDPTPTSASANV